MVLNEYSKAIVGGLVAGLASLQTALLSPGISSNEIIVIVFAVLVGSGLVAAVPNAGTYAWLEQQFRANAALLAQTKVKQESARDVP